MFRSRPIQEQIENPDFQFAEKCHDWRNHVPAIVMQEWPNLSRDAREVAFVMAAKLASREEWD